MSKLISIYLNMNVSETIVVYLICCHCPKVGVWLILGVFFRLRLGEKVQNKIHYALGENVSSLPSFSRLGMFKAFNPYQNANQTHSVIWALDPYPLGWRTIDRFLSVYSLRATQSVVKYQTCLIRKVGRLYGESANDYGELADNYIPTGGSAIESPDWEIESSNSTAESPKVGV